MPSRVIELAALAAADGFVILGAGPDVFASGIVASAGDVNGDGRTDLLLDGRVGGPGIFFTATSHVVYGVDAPTNGRWEIGALGASGGFAQVAEVTEGNVRTIIAPAGDVNGDGIADILIGSPVSTPSFPQGEVYVVYGQAGTARGGLALADLVASDGFVIRGGAANGFIGGSVAAAGDVNHDGLGDLIVGAGGNSRAYVVYGQPGTARSGLDLTELDAVAGFVIDGSATGNRAGRSVAAAGDVNGDGIDDLIVGAPSYDGFGGYSAGEAFVIYGRREATRPTLDLAQLCGDNLGELGATIWMRVEVPRVGKGSRLHLPRSRVFAS